MMKRIALFALTLALAGCSGMGQVQSSLDTFIGKPSTVAIGVFGFPRNVTIIVKRKVYIWTAPAGQDCTMRMVVDPGEIVRNVDVKGAQGQCEQFNKTAP
jgi:hypothetical protein